MIKNPLLKKGLMKEKEADKVNYNRETEEDRIKRMENEIKPFRQKRQVGVGLCLDCDRGVPAHDEREDQVVAEEYWKGVVVGGVGEEGVAG